MTANAVAPPPVEEATTSNTTSTLGPIFIGGPDRCGKTLLAAILGSHHRISIPIVGSNLWTFFYGQFGDLSDDAALERCISAMLRYKHVAFLAPDPDRVRRAAQAGERSYARLFALFGELYAERAGKPRWGDQTGLIERYAEQVLAAYPGARMIHMVRDPRDRYEASQRLWPDGRGRVGGATARWAYSMDLGERNLRHHPDRYRLLRYEDLVRDPEATVREVCAFIGEAFDPAMLDMADAPTFVHKLAGGRSVPGPARRLISADHIGGYRGAIAPSEIAFMESFAGRRMRAQGYQLDRPRLLRRQRARYLLMGLPVNVVRMLAWTWLERLQHRFPGIIGRTPIRSKVLRA